MDKKYILVLCFEKEEGVYMVMQVLGSWLNDVSRKWIDLSNHNDGIHDMGIWYP